MAFELELDPGGIGAADFGMDEGGFVDGEFPAVAVHPEHHPARPAVTPLRAVIALGELGAHRRAGTRCELALQRVVVASQNIVRSTHM